MLRRLAGHASVAAANVVWSGFQVVNRRIPSKSFQPKWAPAPLLKSTERTKPVLGFPRQTDSLCPKCVKEARAKILSGEMALEELKSGGPGEIKADIVERDGEIWMIKTCPDHGRFEDILAIDPENQEALVMLILAITDQLDEGASEREAREFIKRLTSPYQRAYYAGIVSERVAKAVLRAGLPGGGFAAHEALEDAMRSFEQAEELRPLGNDDAILRWNTCARILMRNPSIQPRREDRYEEVLGE